MVKRKTTKHSMIISLICLVLCGAMFLGGTYAWFSDSVTNAENIITTGTLKAGMYWAEGTENPENVSWKDASEDAIFDYAKWEPGYAEVRHIKIENKGDLAFKYQLTVKANGEVSELADAIDVYYADPAKQIEKRSDLTDDMKLGTLTEVLAAMSETAGGNLAAGENVAVTLALKMKEEAGNEYQNLSIGSDFSVVLVATQLSSEDDSFDNQYDFEASYPANGQNKLEEDESAVEIPVTDENNKKVASIVVPSGAIADASKPVEVSYEDSAYEGNFTIASGLEKVVVDITVSNLKENNDVPVKAVIKIAAGLDPETVKLYHYDDEIDCTYNPETGYVTFASTEFSPFTVVYDAESKYEAPETDSEDLPKATVERAEEYENVDLPWESYGAWSPTEGLDSQLEAAYVFSCTETLEQAKVNPYANWYCDFVVMLDKDLGENELFLGGNYGSFGWVGFHNGDLTLDANTEVPLLGSVTSNPWTYLDVVQNVREFTCGVGDVDDALKNKDATFTVMLRLTNPDDEAEFYNVATIKYKFA